ncbi:LOW QUALITY PROTEIN: laminin subunit beta-2-like [Molossus molossus]|uniref:LOW QUALITY PROTEIN: laminin subunit beta-2-like n=1 Tax=Molossus molossus TaxID=27622 RepID=UPI0017477AFE|nr:LOW QUALITY PROTEIN: laminin subunit beta-2-like [Molossus molossus]
MVAPQHCMHLASDSPAFICHVGGGAPRISTQTLLLPVQAPRTVTQEVPDTLAPPGCSSGSCYPPTGNLIVGRGQSLRASSTCGLHGPEPYCVVSHLQVGRRVRPRHGISGFSWEIWPCGISDHCWGLEGKACAVKFGLVPSPWTLPQDSENCFFCDSRDRGGHGIENVISQIGPGGNKTWWQAESGVENVTIQLDLEGAFYFTHLIMTFKTFRPAALVLERSVDHGHSWHVCRYFAHNCSGLFPGIPPAPGHSVNDLVCDQHYSDIEPFTEGKVIFKVLDPAILVENPSNPQIQELLHVTNLRLNFSKLHTLGDRPKGSLKGHPFYYYALYELVVRGSCLCHGHASECRPAPGAPANAEGMVHGLCVCRHHTAGTHCERCQDLYQDHPWHAAEPGHPHACQECECHGHARSCHFDMALYLASGNVSGGVCDACQHNTAGRYCELCQPFFHRDPQEDPRSLHSCKPCDCDPVGALEGGLCDAHTDETRGLLSGQCRCKVNVWGQRCDSCRPGHYGLNLTQSEGCQPCRCDPRGRVPGTHTCDPSSGDCHCKRFVSGRDCSRCLPEFWGLSSDSLGCRPCDCDFGGAYSNRCSAAEGLCLCRPHLHGRRCHELQSGYFCAALDQATAEAEFGQILQPADPRLPAPEEPVPLHLGAGSTLWTGLDFARVVDGAGLSLLAPTVPRALEYDIVLRYETQVSGMDAQQAPEDWQALVSVHAQSLPSSTRCAHPLHSEQLFQAALTHARRAVVLSRPFCFEPGTRYSVTLRLWRTKGVRRPEGGIIFLDSIVLLPRVKELPGLRSVDPGATGRLQELHKAGCMEAARTGLSSAMPESCARLVCSISALLHGGGLPCECHPQGSLSTECALLGGQCPCRPNIIGRTCDHCVPGTYGFGPTGCSECRCHSEGATSAICNPTTGQCTCRAGLAGRRCDCCLPGWWGFPHCQPCACNGHAELCHPLTGICQACHGATTGRHCEKCLDGYYGDPTLGSGQQCRPCLCPGHPASGFYHGTSCHVDSASGRVLCFCAPGYAGPRCDRCSSGYFGNPWPREDPRRSPCRPCQCNNNIDPRDPAACDPHSGHCQRCLHHSHGPGCAHCRPGFHGSALRPRGCRRCSCDPRGTVPARCPSGAEACFCNPVSGQCPCRPHTRGRDCSRCAPLFWNLGGARGCEPCSCHAQHALQPVCHPVTGQCPCRAGFGGRTCSRCQDGYWGDPEQECRACFCNPEGSISPSCDPYTGACLCREGISGLRCQACARGSRGGFPHCMSCPTCFTSWDQRLTLLQLQLEAVAQKAAALCQGIPGWGARGQNGHQQVLEEVLQQAQTLLESPSPAVGTLQQLTEWIAGLRKKMTARAQTLRALAQVVAESEPWVRRQCERLEELSRELDCFKGLAWPKRATGVQDAEAQASSAALLSQEAMLGVQIVATLGRPDSILGQAREARQWTEQLLWGTGQPTGTAVWKLKLKGLANRVQMLHPQLLRLLVKAGVECRGQGPGLACVPVPCDVSPCPWTLPTVRWALVVSRNTSYSLDIAITALQQQQQLLQQIQATASSTGIQAWEAWHRARGPWGVATMAPVQATVHMIQRFLLDEGADAMSVELVAWRGLAVPLPQGGAASIALLLDQIQSALPAPDTGGQELPKAEGVLHHAQHTRDGTVRAQDQALDVQGVLAEAGTHIKAAEQGLQVAKQTLGDLETSVQEVIPLSSLHFLFSGCCGPTVPLRSLTHYDTMMLLNTLTM